MSRGCANTADETGDRCVDIVCLANGQIAYRECRRDPEDGYGWRYLSHAGPEVFDSADAARKAAQATIGWMQA